MLKLQSRFTKIAISFFLVFSLILSIGLLGFAEETTEKEEVAEEEKLQETVTVIDEMIGRIDWEEGYVYAVGDGVPPEDAVNKAQARVRAKRAAIDTAYARLLEMVKKVRVDAESTTANYINESRVVRTKVQGFVKNAEIVKLRHFDDGSYQIRMRMPLNGKKGISEAVLPTQLQKEVEKVGIAYEISQKEEEGSEGTEKTEAKEETAYDSLIVDARGLDIQPVMYPRLVTSSEKVVYSIKGANPNAVLEGGLTSYKPSMTAAQNAAKAGDNPLVVEAIDVTGRNNADIVLPEETADSILKADLSGSFLSQARVVIVTG